MARGIRAALSEREACGKARSVRARFDAGEIFRRRHGSARQNSRRLRRHGIPEQGVEPAAPDPGRQDAELWRAREKDWRTESDACGGTGERIESDCRCRAVSSRNRKG